MGAMSKKHNGRSLQPTGAPPQPGPRANASLDLMLQKLNATEAKSACFPLFARKRSNTRQSGYSVNPSTTLKPNILRFGNTMKMRSVPALPPIRMTEKKKETRKEIRIQRGRGTVM